MTALPADTNLPIYGPDGRPQFFTDPAMDRFVPVVLNLASELWVQTELVANLIAVLERKGLATAADVESLASEVAADPVRDAALGAYLHRVLATLREVAAA